MDVDRAVFRLLPQMQGGSTSTVPPGFLLQRAHHIPAADILLAATGAVDDWSAEREMRVVDRFGTPGGHCHQLLGVGIGPGGLTAPVERVEEANMRRDERRSADDVAQPLAEFTQLRAVLDLDEDGPERGNNCPVTAILATLSGSSPLSLM